MTGMTLVAGASQPLVSPVRILRRARSARLRYAAGLLLAVTLVGCAAPRTTIVLLPDEDGNVGSVSVSGAGGSRQLEQAFSATTVTASGDGPTDSVPLQPEAVTASFSQLMLAQPTKPRVFILYFTLGKAELTAESKAKLPVVLATAQARKPTEISVFGHADSIGGDQVNSQLSAERAEMVARRLKALDPTVGRIEVRWFGSKAPAHPSNATGAQPKNRRAEVMIL